MLLCFCLQVFLMFLLCCFLRLLVRSVAPDKYPGVCCMVFRNREARQWTIRERCPRESQKTAAPMCARPTSQVLKHMMLEEDAKVAAASQSLEGAVCRCSVRTEGCWKVQQQIHMTKDSCLVISRDNVMLAEIMALEGTKGVPRNGGRK